MITIHITRYTYESLIFSGTPKSSPIMLYLYIKEATNLSTKSATQSEVRLEGSRLFQFECKPCTHSFFYKKKIHTHTNGIEPETSYTEESLLNITTLKKLIISQKYYDTINYNFTSTHSSRSHTSTLSYILPNAMAYL